MKWNYILRFTKSNQFDLPNLKTFGSSNIYIQSVYVYFSVIIFIFPLITAWKVSKYSIFGHFTQLMSQWIVQGNTLSFIFIWNINLSRSNPERREKIKLNFYFRTSLRCFIKVFIKPFEAPQGSVKIKIWLNFYFNTTSRTARDVKSLVRFITG